MPIGHSPPRPRLAVGLVGVGAQGRIIAEAMLARGTSLLVHDRRRDATRPLVSRGAKVAATVAELAASVDIAMICVRDDVEVSELLFRGGSMLDRLRTGSILVIHSTVSPALVRRIAREAAAKDVAVVDAPASGGGRRAPLSLMVGGPAAAVEACLPYLGASAGQVILTGECGSGAATKLVHQLVLAGLLLTIKEAKALTGAFGIELETLARAIRLGTAGSSLADRIAGDPPSGPTAALLVKDLELCLEAGRERQIPLPGVEAALAALEGRPGPAR
jgi:3-hydroxyisobutyrate dehydrogenase